MCAGKGASGKTNDNDIFTAQKAMCLRIISLALLTTTQLAISEYEDDFSISANKRDEEGQLVDDLPLQDPRRIRDSDGLLTNITTANPFVGSHAEWVEEAARDVAYYLRAHKFTEFDRRYEVRENATFSYHKWFPRPPLRSLHWEVHKHCDDTFAACLAYLWRRVRETDHRRSDDTAVIVDEQKWDPKSSQAKGAEEECQRLKLRDDLLANPFQGPLERFQWRTTASYYMCWFVMNEVEDLRHLTENCDNFASCLDPTYGPRNRDFRANDSAPFACAAYSFCPDPCCEKRHSISAEDCSASARDNPCHTTSPATKRQCTFRRNENVDFRSLILNRWNVSCECPFAGYSWDSAYGTCVDVDECLLGSHTCKKTAGEACLNVKGSYKCVCKWGHTWNATTGVCDSNVAVGQIKLSALAAATRHRSENQTEKSLIRRIYSYARTRFLEMATSSARPIVSPDADKKGFTFVIYCWLMMPHLVVL